MNLNSLEMRRLNIKSFLYESITSVSYMRRCNNFVGKRFAHADTPPPYETLYQRGYPPLYQVDDSVIFFFGGGGILDTNQFFYNLCNISSYLVVKRKLKQLVYNDI